jgi:hypothetical protein
MRKTTLSVAGLLVGIFAGMTLAVQHDFVKEENTWTGHKSSKLTQLEPYNLRSPIDFFGGPVYMRYECIDKPGESPDYKTEIQMCTWIGGASNEYCGAHLKPHYYKKGVYFWKMNNGEWFQHRLNGKIDWTTKVTVRAIHRYNGGKWLGICSYCCSAQNNPCTQEILNKWYLPTKYKVHVIMVKPGDVLVPPADWDGCPFPGCAAVNAKPIDMGNGFYYAEPIKKAGLVYSRTTRSIKISGINTTREDMRANIIDASGTIVKTIALRPSASGLEAQWDGADKSGQQVSKGIYLLTIDRGEKTGAFRLIK